MEQSRVKIRKLLSNIQQEVPGWSKASVPYQFLVLVVAHKESDQINERYKPEEQNPCQPVTTRHQHHPVSSFRFPLLSTAQQVRFESLDPPQIWFNFLYISALDFTFLRFFSFF